MTSERFEYEFKWFKDDFDTTPESRGRLFVNRSPLESLRSEWEPSVIFDPPMIASSMSRLPRVGIVLTGEWVPASGTHNVIVGIVRHIVGSLRGTVLGFLGGPQGFARGHYVSLTLESVSKYLNQGGCDMLGFGSLRAIDDTAFVEIENLVAQYELTGLIFVGGPKELGHVAQLVDKGRDKGFIPIISILQSPNSSISADLPTLGFDSARAALAEYVGNIGKESSSLHFVRSGSTTTTMELALEIGPAYAVLAEEGIPISDLVALISQIVRDRNNLPTLVLVGDKFFANLPGFLDLQLECRQLYQKEPSLTSSVHLLTPQSQALLSTFSETDQLRLMRAYDSDGNPTVPETAPEQYLANLIKVSKTHSLEIRSPLPTNFDCEFGLALGYAAAHLTTQQGTNGWIVNVKVNEKTWTWGGIPIDNLLVSKTTALSSIDAPLSVQSGGANQELINLARQRVERESTVPRISLRFENKNSIFTDPLFLQYSRVREVDRIATTTRQPGPYQFGDITCGQREEMSCLQQKRVLYRPQLPLLTEFREAKWTSRRASKGLLQLVFPHTNGISAVKAAAKEVAPKMTLRIGIVFLGRASPGCHNVVWGLIESGATVVGILQGSYGLVNNLSVSNINIESFRNQAGIHLLGRSDTVLKSRADFLACANTCRSLQLDGLVVVGGIGTHADTALLAEVLVAENVPTRLIGVPASVRNDIPLVEQTLGHDTACKAVASIVGSLATLAASAKRRWCIVRVLGGSHVLAESALQTHASLVLTSEELASRRMNLSDIVKIISDLVSERDFGVILIPETLNPDTLQSHVSRELQRRKIFSSTGSGSFLCSTHCIGVEVSRSSLPSNFDSDLGYTMGYVAGKLISANKSGLMVNITNLAAATKDWIPEGIPLTSFLTVTSETAHNCLVSIDEKSVEIGFCSGLPRPVDRRFKAPGPIQFSGPLADVRLTRLEQATGTVDLAATLAKLMHMAANASDESVVRVIQAGLDYARAVAGDDDREVVDQPSHCRLVGIERV